MRACAIDAPHNAEPQVAVEVLGLADRCGLDGLKSLCESAIMHCVDSETVCSLFSAAHRHGVSGACVRSRTHTFLVSASTTRVAQAATLKRCCLEHILKHSPDAASLEALSAEPVLLLEVTRELMFRQQRK